MLTIPQFLAFLCFGVAILLRLFRVKKPARTKEDTEHSGKSALWKLVDPFSEFGFWLIVFYISDRTDLLPRSEKHYDRDLYWFIWLFIFAGGLASIKQVKPQKDDPEGHVKPLQRDQTEEWKGWMQIQFLMYHYFNATELYNCIRLYIAAYVWMTGFGNFSFYYIRADFGMKRFSSMMLRLNWLVLWCIPVMQNDYMLYYICMLHTTFTVFIYVGLAIHHQLNQKRSPMFIKFGLFFLVTAIIWEFPSVFDAIWSPLGPLVTYKGSLHEWKFRSTLDHYVWIFGMIFAYNFPKFNDILIKIDSLEKKRQYFVKGVIIAGTLLVLKEWYERCFLLPKKEYNALHPYTSFIPITAYCILRNIFTISRKYYMSMFSWLGKITLETYIAQFHIWLATMGPNTNPKQLIRILPEGYPLLNFALISVIYIFISLRLKHVSDDIKDAFLKFIPDKKKPVDEVPVPEKPSVDVEATPVQ